MERLAYLCVTALAAHGPLVLVRWSRSQRGLPLFMAAAWIRIAWGLLRRRIAVLHLGDPVLALLGALVRRAGIPVLVTVHGLDILYPGKLYQAYLRHFFWHRYDAYLCISRFVAEAVLAHGIPPAKVRVLPLGIDVASSTVVTAPLRGSGPVLLVLGRLVPRKGVAWFIAEVGPLLFARHPDATLVIAGAGPELARIEDIVQAKRLSSHVQIVGAVDDARKMTLLAECDAVLMPNIPVLGDAEGFGLVALEAGAAGKAVFAADLEGLRDAIRPGENGWLLPASDANAWLHALDRALADRVSLASAGLRARSCVEAHYDWVEIGERYATTVAEFARP